MEILHSGSDLTNPRTQQLTIAYTEDGQVYLEPRPNDVMGRDWVLTFSKMNVMNRRIARVFILRDDRPLWARRLTLRDTEVINEELTGEAIPAQVRAAHAERWKQPPPA